MPKPSSSTAISPPIARKRLRLIQSIFLEPERPLKLDGHIETKSQSCRVVSDVSKLHSRNQVGARLQSFLDCECDAGIGCGINCIEIYTPAGENNGVDFRCRLI